MKRVILYSIILAATLIVPQRRTDIGKLRPIEVVYLGEYGELLEIRTDTEDYGVGATIPEAIGNLKETTAGEIFLDTADYLVVSESMVQNLEEIKRYLHKGVRICIGSQDIDLELAARYLSVHKPKCRLDSLEGWSGIEKLEIEHGKMILQKMKKGVDK